jgi:hypothetical protein
MHAVADGQETPDRLLSVAPVAFGVAWTVHVAPLRRSARVNSVPDLLK